MLACLSVLLLVGILFSLLFASLFYTSNRGLNINREKTQEEEEEEGIYIYTDMEEEEVEKKPWVTFTWPSMPAACYMETHSSV